MDNEKMLEIIKEAQTSSARDAERRDRELADQKLREERKVDSISIKKAEMELWARTFNSVISLPGFFDHHGDKGDETAAENADIAVNLFREHAKKLWPEKK